MSELNRRGLLKMGVGSLAGLAAGGLLPLANPTQPGIVRADLSSIELVNGSFVLDQRVISQVDADANQALQSAPWGIPSEYESLLPKLVSPISVNLSEIEEWVTTRCSETCTGPEAAVSAKPDWSVLETLMNVPTCGLPNVSDLVGKTITTIADGASLDLSLEFLYDSRLEQMHRVLLPLVSSGVFQQGATITPIEAPRLATAADLVAAGPPSITMYGWKLQFRGPETHPLKPCESQSVKHFNVEVFRQNSGGRWDYVLNVHLGAYRSGGRRCFVLFNNTRPYVCWKICSPTSNQLREMFKWILIAAAAIAGVALAAWIISVIASAAAAVVFPVLLLL